MTEREKLIDKLNNIKKEPTLAELQKETADFFSEQLWISTMGRKAFIWTIVGAVATIVLLIILLPFCNIRILDISIYAIWTIGPPAWFMYEYTWLFPDKLKFDSSQLNDMKYKHELSAKIWGGLVLLITAILIYKYGNKIV